MGHIRKLRYIGTDWWSRPVYKDQAGKIWVDINLGEGVPFLHSVVDNEMDGEPDRPLRGEYRILETGENKQCIP